MTDEQRPAREAEAMRIVYTFMAVSAGAALIPAPGVDVAVLAGIHVTLIKKLCDHYGVSFSEHTARNLLIAIAASVMPGTLGSVLGRKVIRLLPAVGRGFGWVLWSASSAAFSYGIGRLFIYHFESGGTLLDFDPQRLHRVFIERPAPAAGLASAQ
jgi:uncharacterized protein (DUF697 family)